MTLFDHTVISKSVGEIIIHYYIHHKFAVKLFVDSVSPEAGLKPLGDPGASSGNVLTID